jgi:4-amino-4-deoxy-L-arabinose transferase-like glycosyltransferase
MLGAAVVYLLGLGSLYAPTNGDEMVYVHIARQTADNGQWLPLVSDLANMRNTKPPLLIWQAMVAGGWGDHWNLAALRLPSMLYTLATTLLIALNTQRWSGQLRTACLAAVVYLACFSTFRYCRVYLTSAPETFWLSLPLFWLMLTRLPGADSSPPPRPTHALRIPALAYVLCGIALGLGCAYKSFAMVAPAGATLWCAIVITHPDRSPGALLRAGMGVAASSVIALGIFGLWFALDPDPAAVWKEFVLGENAGKMVSTDGYWHDAFFGGSTIWLQCLAYFENAGLLWLVTLGLALAGLSHAMRKRHLTASPHARILLVWLLIWMVVFCIPSQRSARYVIPAMPALAMLAAHYWERIAHVWFRLTLLLIAPVLVLLARIAWVIGALGDAPHAATDGALVNGLVNGIATGMDASTRLLWIVGLAMSVSGLVVVIVGLVSSRWSRSATLLGCLLVYGSFSCMVAPLEAPAAQYSLAVQQRLANARIAVPNGFNAQYERFHFALPASLLIPYDVEGRNTGALYPELTPDVRLTRLLAEHDAVVWIQDQPDQNMPTCAPHCVLIGQRWHVKSRHHSGEITLDNLWFPQEWLFRREWLIVATP